MKIELFIKDALVRARCGWKQVEFETVKAKWPLEETAKNVKELRDIEHRIVDDLKRKKEEKHKHDHHLSLHGAVNVAVVKAATPLPPRSTRRL